MLQFSMNAKEVSDNIANAIKDYFIKNNFKKAVIGLSGGIDSAVSACLAVMAIGSENVTALLLPDLETTSKQSTEDAENLAKKLKIRYNIIPINELMDCFESASNLLKSKKSAHAMANAKARIRMVVLYYFANLNNALVIGTSDKSEILLGYATKYGDNASDIIPIGGLWKTELYELGKYLGVPQAILSKKSSPELVAGQTAEKELGAPYEVLDEILKMHIEDKLSSQEIIKKGFDKKIVENIFDRIKINEHKSKQAPIIQF